MKSSIINQSFVKTADIITLDEVRNIDFTICNSKDLILLAKKITDASYESRVCIIQYLSERLKSESSQCNVGWYNLDKSRYDFLSQQQQELIDIKSNILHVLNTDGIRQLYHGLVEITCDDLRDIDFSRMDDDEITRLAARISKVTDMPKLQMVYMTLINMYSMELSDDELNKLNIRERQNYYYSLACSVNIKKLIRHELVYDTFRECENIIMSKI